MKNEQINISIEEIIRPALHGNIYRPTRDCPARGSRSAWGR